MIFWSPSAGVPLWDDAGSAVARRASVQWSARTCEGTRHLAIVHHTKPQRCLTLGHTLGAGAAWYGIPASNLSSHYLFVLLYLQTIHCGDLPGKESAAKAWMMALGVPFPGCSLILSILNGGRRPVGGWSTVNLSKMHSAQWTVVVNKSYWTVFKQPSMFEKQKERKKTPDVLNIFGQLF